MSENNMKQDNNSSQKTYGFWAFTPILVFLLIYIGGGIVREYVQLRAGRILW